MTPTLVIIGDTHMDPTAIVAADRATPPGVPFLHVGDLDYHSDSADLWARMAASLQREVFTLHGNHDRFELAWRDATEPVRLAPQLSFVPDGTVLTVGGLRVGCVGGATSIDRRDREPIGRWDPHEALRPSEVARAMSMGPVDLLVTHCPPQDIIERLMLPKELLRHYGLPLSWRDPVAAQIQAIRAAVGQPPVVSGHIHVPFAAPELGAYIVGMDRVLPWPVPDDADPEGRHRFP